MEEQRRKQYEDEMRRLEREAEERDRQKRLQEHEEVQKKVARERLDQLRSTELGEKAFTGITEEVRHAANDSPSCVVLFINHYCYLPLV